jgi:hypothetical protein
MEILYDHDALPVGAILGELRCPRNIRSVDVVRNSRMMMRAGDSMSFISPGVGSKGARYRNRSPDGFRAPTDEVKNDIQPRHLRRLKRFPKGV